MQQFLFQPLCNLFDRQTIRRRSTNERMQNEMYTCECKVRSAFLAGKRAGGERGDRREYLSWEDAKNRGMDWTGLDWNWTGLDWTGLGWAELPGLAGWLANDETSFRKIGGFGETLLFFLGCDVLSVWSVGTVRLVNRFGRFTGSSHVTLYTYGVCFFFLLSRMKGVAVVFSRFSCLPSFLPSLPPPRSSCFSLCMWVYSFQFAIFAIRPTLPFCLSSSSSTSSSSSFILRMRLLWVGGLNE